VFQCIRCRAIVGDSIRTLGTFQDLGALATEVCSANVASSVEITTSTRASDRGSTYRVLNCAVCCAVLGRSYLTAPPHLEVLRGAITFDIGSLQSYVLGSSQTASSLTMNPNNFAKGGSSTGAEAAVVNQSMSAVSSSVEDELRAELLKVQTIILSINERVSNIEQREILRTDDLIGDDEAVTSPLAGNGCNLNESPKRRRVP